MGAHVLQDLEAVAVRTTASTVSFCRAAEGARLGARRAMRTKKPFAGSDSMPLSDSRKKSPMLIAPVPSGSAM